MDEDHTGIAASRPNLPGPVAGRQLVDLLVSHPVSLKRWEGDQPPETVVRAKPLTVQSTGFDPCASRLAIGAWKNFALRPGVATLAVAHARP